VVGVDNEAELCDLSDPPLLQRCAQHERIGYGAAALLDRLMAGKKVPPGRFLIEPAGVVARRSTEVWRLKTAKSPPLPVHSRTRLRNIDVSDVLKAQGCRAALSNGVMPDPGSFPKIRNPAFRLNRASNCWLKRIFPSR